jgi:hypothetical protein
MRRSFVCLGVLAAVAIGGGAVAREKQALKPPPSIQAEHHEIHEALVALTKATGPVGVAAKALAATLHPHFLREEEIALPPLGLLAPLAAGKTPAGIDEALVMADTLKKELPRMLEEHEAIRAAVERLARVSKQERHAEGQAFAAALALHAQTEEEVLYPAAILVGDLIRARRVR